MVQSSKYMPYLTNVNGKLVFAGMLFSPGDQILDGVFASDGTAEGTVQLAPVQLKPQTFEMEVVGNTVYFPGSTGDVNQLQLWESDGTPAGTHQVYQPRPSAANPHYLTKVGDTLFFFVDGGANARRTGGLTGIGPPEGRGRSACPKTYPGSSAGSAGSFRIRW